jgi:hypothetical protein
MRSIFDDMEYACNAYGKGIDYANMVERVRECERKQKEQCTTTMTISFLPARHYPVRAHGRRL